MLQEALLVLTMGRAKVHAKTDSKPSPKELSKLRRNLTGMLVMDFADFSVTGDNAFFRVSSQTQ